MSLASIKGQDAAITKLSGILRRDRLASAYLFCGESGIGKRTTAINFAKALNCQGKHAAESHDACDACDSCGKTDAGTHPDVLLVSPEEHQIRIEEIRAIDDALSFKPFEGRRKIVIVDDADAMNIPAANAFLKTLEEPPSDSLIILITSKPDRLPATIRSRCSRLNFATLSLEACANVLKASLPADSLERAARLSLGRPGAALAGDLLEEREWFFSLLQGMLKAEKDAWTSRADMELWLDYALVLLRDMTMLKITGAPSSMINADMSEEIKKLGISADINGIIDIHRELNCLKGVMVFNLNKAIVWNYLSSLLRGLSH